ncbi:MAG: DUF3360 domain-containing protein [Clostridia bacterium]|nr:DUF3360 domain-containing protein [Clostridia bacterium]
MRGKKLRQEMLENSLISYNPKKWNINIPFRDYDFMAEDLIPAMSGAIGKAALVAAFAMAWAAGFNITDPAFVIENVRLELVLGSILTIIFCSILNPYAGPPGTLAPMIPIIPAIAAAGIHPLPLGILIGAIGLVISVFKFFNKVVELNGPGTKGGIILLFGFLGITSSLDNLKSWAVQSKSEGLFIILLAIGLALYILLSKLRARWLIIPACAAAAIAVPFVFGHAPELKTGIGLPIMNPNVWWNEKWATGWGLNVQSFVKATPFAILAVVMWPIDALTIKTIQEDNYPREAKKAVFDMDSTYVIVSIRNIVGVLFGGGQVSAIWRSFMIPLSTVKRPIGSSALVLGILGILAGILGFPLDMAVYPPLLWLVLIFGVYVPLWETGLANIKNAASAQVAAVCVIAGIAANPVLGWIASIFIENFGIIKGCENGRSFSRKDLYITAVLIIITVATFLSAYFL